MSRMTDLLDAAADSLDEQCDPFHQAFLVQHDVTYDEMMDLSEWMAAGARLVSFAIQHPELARAALNGAAHIAAYQAAGRGLDRLLQNRRA